MKPLIYVVDDDHSVRRLMEHWLKTKWEYNLQLFTSGEQCLDALDAGPNLIILDVMLPGISGVETLREIRKRDTDVPVIMLSAQGQIDIVVETIKLGAMDYFPKTIDLNKMELAVRNALEMYSLKRELHQLRDSVAEKGNFDNIIASAGPMENVLKLAHKAMNSDISVLIQGESGTGKELIARAIHFNGKRKNGPFVAVNSAAIPRELIESEMFGHEKGAFTGAVARKIGKFEQASGGTIFLDEIGELDVNLQAKLLRAIQQKQFERVGGTETLTSDVRIVSATNRDLMKASQNKEFREDLYYRLASFPIMLPPLRERKSDVMTMAEHFLNIYSKREGKIVRTISRKAIKMLFDYPWPGNVRELESAIERAVLLCDGDTITENDLPLAVRAFADGEDVAIPMDSVFENQSMIIPLEALKEQAVKHALKVTEGNIFEAAKKLRISRSTMYEMMRKYEVKA